MKKILFCLAMLLAVSCGNPKGTIPQFKYGGLNGKIESVKESYYSAEEKFGENIPEDLRRVIITEFNSYGFVSKISYFDQDGDRERTEILSYNDKGDFIGYKSSNENDYSPYPEPSQYSLTIRDKDQAVFQTESSSSHIIYTYKDLTETRYNKDGNIETVIKYNKKGQILEVTQYDDNGKLHFKGINTYNSKGLLETQTMYNEEGDIQNVTHYKYADFDKKGNWTTQYVFDDDNIWEIVKLEIKYK